VQYVYFDSEVARVEQKSEGNGIDRLETADLGVVPGPRPTVV
jgi:hypothetical protein